MEHYNYLFAVNHFSLIVMIIAFLAIIISSVGFITPMSYSKKNTLTTFQIKLMKTSIKMTAISMAVLMLALVSKYATEHFIIKNSLQLLQDNTITIKINGITIKNREFTTALAKSFEVSTSSKVKGSHPTQRTEIDVYQDKTHLLTYVLGQDSRDLNMYWLRAHAASYSVDLGFIHLNPALLNIDTGDQNEANRTNAFLRTANSSMSVYAE